ncbi:MAG: hypothetical protein LBT53_04520 [Puniceicoccales bacterium]|jgi:hypothetical protein|nr:hypothetical protein [Puniceicoccales bacterium]
MTRAKKILVAVPALLAAAAGGFLFYVTRPSVQRAFVLRELAAAGISAELENCSASLGGKITFEKLALELPECRIECAGGSAEIGWLALFSNRAEISALRLTGVEADFTQKTPRTKTAEKKERDGDAKKSVFALRITGTEVSGGVRLENKERLTFAARQFAFDSDSGASLDFESTGGTIEKFTAKGGAKLVWEKPQNGLPQTAEAALALNPKSEVNANFEAAGGGSATLALASVPAKGEHTWTFSARRNASRAESKGKISGDGSLGAETVLGDFSSADFAFLPFWDAARWPSLTRLSGKASFTRKPASAATPAPLETVFDLSGDAAGLGRLEKSLAGYGALNLHFAGNAAFAASDEWALNLGVLEVADAATRRPLLAGKLAVTAKQGGACVFAASAGVRAEGFAEQPAWRELLAKVAREGWRGEFDAKGSAFLPTAKSTRTAVVPAADTTTADTASIGSDTATTVATTVPLRVVLETASLRAMRGDAPTPLLQATLLHALDTAAAPVADGKPLFRVAAQHFPLELATPFLGGATLSGTAAGALDISRDARRFRAAAPNAAPLRLEGVSFRDAGGKLRLGNLTVRGGVVFAIEPTTWKAWELEISRANVGGVGETPLSGSLALAWDAGVKTLTGNFYGDSARLLRQPLLGNCSNLQAAKINLSAKYVRGGDCDIRAVLEDIRGADGGASLRKVAASAIGKLDPLAPVLRLPVRLEGANERKSDLTLTLAPADIAGSGAWGATLTGEQVALADALRLNEIFKKHKTRGEELEERNRRDELPFWDGAGEGRCIIAIRKIILPEPEAIAPSAAQTNADAVAVNTLSATSPTATPMPTTPSPSTPTPTPPSSAATPLPSERAPAAVLPGFGDADAADEPAPKPAATRATTARKTPAAAPSAKSTAATAATPPAPSAVAAVARSLPELRDVAGVAALKGETLTLSGLVAAFGSGSFAGGGKLVFRKAQQEVYALDGDAKVHDLPFESFTGSFAPAAEKIVSGKINVTAKFSSTAINTRRLAENVELGILAESKGGRVSILKADTEATQLAGGVADTVGGLADLGAGFFGGGRRKQGGGLLQTLRQLRNYLDDFPYDVLRIRAERRRDGGVSVPEMRIANNLMAVAGSGEIKTGAADLTARPLTARARFFGKKEIAALLTKLKLAEGVPDAEGFTMGPEFRFSGTLGALQNNLFETLLKALQKNASVLAPAAGAVVGEGTGLLPF